MTSGFDLSAALRRLKPEKRKGVLTRRPDPELSYVDGAEPAGAPLLLDTCVYLHVLRGKSPEKVDDLLRTRTLLHSAVTIGELTNRFGSRHSSDDRTRAALAKLEELVSAIPSHRIVTPGLRHWGEAGILAGLRARLGGFLPGQEQDGLNDALIYIQALTAGAEVLTANVSDFDLLEQLAPGGRALYYRALP